MRNLFTALPVLVVTFALTGCGETTVITPDRTTKVEVKEDATKVKETTVKQNTDGTTTKTTTKTEVK